MAPAGAGLNEGEAMVNWVDLILLGVFGFAVCLGFQKGFVKQVATLGSLVLGVVLAGRYHAEVAGCSSLAFLVRQYGEDTAVVVAYLGIFAAVVLGAQLAAALIHRGIQGKALEPMDSLLGGAVGAAKVYVACGLLSIGIFQFLPHGGLRHHFARSFLAPRMAESMRQAFEQVPRAYRVAFLDLFEAQPSTTRAVGGVHAPTKEAKPLVRRATRRSEPRFRCVSVSSRRAARDLAGGARSRRRS
jgi:membrane protein required for colicin V production